MAVPGAGESRRIFDKYEIIERLAVGGMGEIFLARQVGFDRLVILKSLLPELAGRRGFVDMFLDEAHVVAKLNHPNIVAIYEVGVWDGTYYIAMEYIDGVDIATLMQSAYEQGRRIPFRVMARIIQSAAIALDYAHNATDLTGTTLGIVHRDVSPHNIMVRSDGVSKVVDFGIAKAVGRATRTATGAVKGKLQYMAPEQLRSEVVDGRSDQFALGVVAWEMLTLQQLFTGDNQVATMNKVLEEPIPPVSELVPDTPAELVSIIARMLQRTADDRFASCDDVARALGAWLVASGCDTADTWVREEVHVLAGARIAERMRGIGASRDAAKPSNFVVPLSPPSATTVNLAGRAPVTPRKRHRAPVVLGVVAAVLVGIGVRRALITRAAPGPAVPADALATTEPTSTKPTSAKPTSEQPTSEQPTPEQPPSEQPPAEPAALSDGPPQRINDKLTRPTKRWARPAAREPGYLTLRTTPPTQVTIDGHPYGATPLFRIELAAGVHDVELVDAHGARSKRKLTVVAGELTKQSWGLPPAP